MTIFKILNTDKKIINFSSSELIEGDTAYPVLSTASGCPITGLAFSDGITERMYSSFEIPNNWVIGSDIIAYVHYFNNTTQSGEKVCSWIIDYQIFNDLENVSDKTTTRAGVDSILPESVNSSTYIKAELTISGSDTYNPISKNKFFSFSVCRGCDYGDDTMDGDAILALLSFEIEVEV